MVEYHIEYHVVIL